MTTPLSRMKDKEMDLVYIVHREGVYRHEVIGVYADLEKAKQAARDALKAEEDDYHDMGVVQFAVNSSEEEVEVYRVSRNKRRAERRGFDYLEMK